MLPISRLRRESLILGLCFFLGACNAIPSQPNSGTGLAIQTSSIAASSSASSLAAAQISSLMHAWTCGNDWVDDRDGALYPTVRFGERCWMANNMNIGTMTAGEESQGTSCSSIKKHCYANSEENCETYGGLYQWDQAMCGSASGRAQGICPAGWHVPAHDEWTTLERAVCASGTCETDFPYDASATGWRGTNEGSLLKSGGFTGLLAGYRDTQGAFGYLAQYGNFWTSSQSDARAWFRDLGLNETTIGRNTENTLLGFSVRCVKD